MCPHILTLTNIRTALRSWWENSGDVIRILLTAAADPRAWQGAEMSDTITLYTRILLTTQDPRSKELDHGGSGRAAGTRGSKKRNKTELLGCSRQSRIGIYSRSGRLNPSTREAIVLSWSFKVWAHKQARTLVKVIDSRPQIKVLYLWLRTNRGYRRGNFGIKLFLSQNWGACVYTKIWEEERGNSKLPRLSHQGIDCIMTDISWFRCGTGIGSLWMTSADNDNELRLASRNTCQTLQKGKD